MYIEQRPIDGQGGTTSAAEAKQPGDKIPKQFRHKPKWQELIFEKLQNSHMWRHVRKRLNLFF